jgi:hypothetical protein
MYLNISIYISITKFVNLEILNNLQFGTDGVHNLMTDI